jgi:hypothetical protein
MVTVGQGSIPNVGDIGSGMVLFGTRMEGPKTKKLLILCSGSFLLYTRRVGAMRHACAEPPQGGDVFSHLMATEGNGG